MRLEIEFKQSGMIYGCPSGQHDDLAYIMRPWRGPRDTPISRNECGALEPRAAANPAPRR